MSEIKKDGQNWFKQHPNWTLFFGYVLANLVALLGLRMGGNFELVLVILAVIIIFVSEIWSISEKGRSQLNLLWNLLPYLGWLMILLLDYKLISIEVKSPNNLTVGSNESLTATGKSLNGQTKNIKGANWNSSNNSVATVNSDGLVTGVGLGSCEITCTSDDTTSKSVTLIVTGN